MQQVVRLQRPAATGQGMSLPASSMTLLTLLDEARDAVVDGDFVEARLICAEATALYQPQMVRDRSLLETCLALMVRARGFQMASRLLAAIYGQKIRFIVQPRADSRVAISHSDSDGALWVSVSEGFLDEAASVNQWAAELLRTPRPSFRPPSA